jgi:hypothetical protein
MRAVDPPKLVHVRRDENWHPGWLQAWRRDGTGWLAYMRYMGGVGMRQGSPNPDNLGDIGNGFVLDQSGGGEPAVAFDA